MRNKLPVGIRYNEKPPRYTYSPDYFWERFKFSGLNNFKSMSKKKRYQKIDKRVYKRIIKRFLIVYFYELLFINKPMYFFFGGTVTKTRVGNFYKGGSYIARCVSFLWYNRPNREFFMNCRYNLSRTRNSPIVLMKNEWMAANDVGELPAMRQKMDEVIENKTMFRYL